MYTSVKKISRRNSPKAYSAALRDRNISHKQVMTCVEGKRWEEEVLFCQHTNKDTITYYIRTKNWPKNVDAARKQEIPEPGTRVRFYIELAPIVRTCGKEKILKGDERDKWASAKLTSAGLDVTEIKCHQVEAFMRRTENGRTRKQIPLYACSGFAYVRDRAALHRALENGIGRYKSFGAGMLMIL